ncbi:Anthocyanidin 5,3-O-glucosyltransferase [Hordeum vulgare]|nr:Anthocyanidin 5,3-O-glucosyltransferase [Hordeum vulgare]
MQHQTLASSLALLTNQANSSMAPVAKQGGGAPHLVFIPSAGMGHLLPFSRFIGALASEGVFDISVVTALPTVSEAEAEQLAALFASFPAIRRIDFNLLPLDDATLAGTDPFFLRWESLRRSAHLLGPLIAGATPRASAIVTDVTLASQVIPIAKDELQLPCHILFISCATMLSFLAYFPTYLDETNTDHLAGDVHVPAIGHIPVDYPPQVLRNPDSLFTKQFIANGREITEADGILVNTFHALEPEALTALRDGKVVPGFPPVFAVGPLKSTTTGKEEAASAPIAWLGEQPARSVVYVAFGNRNAAALDQIREIGAGLEASGCRFLWVVKTTVVDRDDTAELNDVLGDGFLARVHGRGLVTKEWVDQEAVLKHPAVGLYLSHCGWNSVTESAAYGVPMLAWPTLGDQRLISTVIRSGGFGLWVEHWSWDGGEDSLVRGAEIAEKVKEVMGDEAISAKAKEISQAAAKAVAEGGSSYRSMQEFLATLS